MTPQTPFFSVVTIVRNDVAGFTRTAESVAKQAYRNFEWIVIDGNSTDGTVEAIKGLASSIAFWISERDEGIYDAMNKGIGHATGKYVVFMNSGDVFYSAETLTIVSQAVNNAKKADMIWGESILRFSSGRTIRKRSRPTSYLRHSLAAVHQSTFVDLQWHKRFLFNKTFKICGDHDAISRMVVAGAHVVHLNEPLSVRDCDPSSATASARLIHYKESARIQRDVFKLNYFLIVLSGVKRFVSKSAFRLLSGSSRK